MWIKIQPRMWNDEYYQIENSDPFSIAVNKKLSSYWVETGREISVENAVIEVFKDFYNEQLAQSKAE